MPKMFVSVRTLKIVGHLLKVSDRPKLQIFISWMPKLVKDWFSWEQSRYGCENGICNQSIHTKTLRRHSKIFQTTVRRFLCWILILLFIKVMDKKSSNLTEYLIPLLQQKYSCQLTLNVFHVATEKDRSKKYQFHFIHSISVYQIKIFRVPLFRQ